MIEAEDLLDGCDVRITPAAAAVFGDALLVLARAAVRSETPERLPGVVVALLDALQASAALVSDVGSAAAPSGIVDDVGSSWVTADVAGERVGLSSRRVRQLAASGAIARRTAGPRSPVFVDQAELQRYLSG